MIMVCSRCGTLLTSGIRVCPKCGTPVAPNIQNTINSKRETTTAVLGGVIGGFLLVFVIGILLMISWKNRWIDIGPRHSFAVTALAYRLDDELPYLSLYIGRPDQDPFELPPGNYYVEAFDQEGYAVQIGEVTISDDNKKSTIEFPRDFSKSDNLFEGNEKEDIGLIAEFLLLVDYSKLTWLEIISDGFTETPYGGEQDISLSALDPLHALYAQMSDSEAAVSQAVRQFQSRALETANLSSIEKNVPRVKMMSNVRGWFNVLDKLSSFFGLTNENANNALTEIQNVYNALTPEQRVEAFESLQEVNRQGAQNFDEFIQKITNGEIPDIAALAARGDFHNSIDYEQTVQNLTPGMNRPHLNIAHNEGAAAVKAGAEVYVEIIKAVLTTQFPGMNNGFDYADKADKWSGYVRDLFTNPNQAFENFTTDQIKDYLSEQIKTDLGELDPGLGEDELGEIAGAIADRVTQQIVADIKSGTNAITGGQAETEEVATEESNKPDFSWIPGYVNGVGGTLKDQGLRRAAIEVIKGELQTCLENEVKAGSSQNEAIGACQYILDEIKEEPTATSEPVVETDNFRNFAGSWHGGGLCGEDDDPAYRWNVDLQQDANGVVTGVISFHACPGGGAVYYDVTGQATSDKKLVLQGIKTSGRGGLNVSVPSSVQFTLKYNGEPSPSYTR